MNAPSFESIKLLDIDDIKAELQGTEKKFLSHTVPPSLIRRTT